MSKYFSLFILVTSITTLSAKKNHMTSLPVKQIWQNPTIKPTLFSKPTKTVGAVNTLGLHSLNYELDGAIKVFHLTAQPIETTIVDTNRSTLEHLIPPHNKIPGVMKQDIVQRLRCWGYNGSMPGPTIEAEEGDRIRVIVKNELPEPTSIHWHGIEVPNSQDGAAPEVQKPIMPGETYTYEFTLHQSGTFLYHSGFNVSKQDSWGLTGMLVTHPKQYEQPVDKQFAVLMQQWSILPGNLYPNLVTMDFNWFTFNGIAAPNVPIMEVNQGERVRIRFGNVSMDSHPIHIHGYTWEEVGTEGGPIPLSARRKGSTINVPPGTTRDVEFVAWNPGVWRFHCHKLHHIMNAHAEVPMSMMPHGGMFTLLHVIPKDQNQIWEHPKTTQEKLLEKTIEQELEA